MIKSEEQKKKEGTVIYRLVALIALTFMGAAVLLLLWVWLTTTNRLEYFQFTVTMTEKRVLPLVPADELIEPAPFIFGEVDLDLKQLEIRWKLMHSLGDALPHPPASLDIRGPLKQEGDTITSVAPVVVGLGLGKDSRGRYKGILDVEEKTALRILEDRHNYYISMSDTHGREIARDALDKVSTSLV